MQICHHHHSQKKKKFYKDYMIVELFQRKKVVIQLFLK